MSQIAVGAVAGAIASRVSRRFSFDSPTSSTPKSGGKHVGILAMEVYTPSTFVSQDKLEDHSGVSKGRYTIGLGQEGLGICGDCEDVNSLSLTVVQSLMEK